jgi:hypothetical protein
VVMLIMTSLMQQPYIGMTCDHCSYGKMTEPANGQEWHLECDECKAILFCYTPLPHQEDFHKDNAKYKLYAGGYG